MKKNIISLLAIILLGTKATFAATGAAYDGLFFMLGIAGVLLLLYLVLTSIDFLAHNGKKIFHAITQKISNVIHMLRRHKLTRHTDPVC